MTTYAIDKVIRTAATFTQADGSDAVCVLHFASPATCVQHDVDEASVAWHDLFSTITDGAGFHMKDAISNQVHLISATARTIDPANPLEAIHVASVVGTDVGPQLPLETSLVTTHYTALPTRSGRGRTFLPGCEVGEMSNGDVNPGMITPMATVWANWQAALQAVATIEHVVWSPTLAIARTVETYLVRGKWHHQKRRNR